MRHTQNAVKSQTEFMDNARPYLAKHRYGSLGTVSSNVSLVVEPA